MPNVKSNIFLYRLLNYSDQYIDECIANVIEEVSQGKIVKKSSRHIPTIDFFLRIWIPRNHSKKDTIKRSTYYRWLNWSNTEKQRVIEFIDKNFKALAKDIVANEGKGIFYAKNALDMHDRPRDENENEKQITISLKDLEIVVNKSLNDSE